MTFKTQRDVDVGNVFLNSTEFAEDIIYTPVATGTPATISAVVADPRTEVVETDKGEDQTEIVEVHIAVADVATPVRGDTVTISGVVWTVRVVTTPDGMHELECVRVTPKTRSSGNLHNKTA